MRLNPSLILHDNHILLYSVKFHKHCLYLNIIVLSHVHQFTFKLINLPILLLLALDKIDGMTK